MLGIGGLGDFVIHAIIALVFFLCIFLVNINPPAVLALGAAAGSVIILQLCHRAAA